VVERSESVQQEERRDFCFMNLHSQCSGIPVGNWDELSDSSTRLHHASEYMQSVWHLTTQGMLHKLNNAGAKEFGVFHFGILENFVFFPV
jgi:hypothetical protein